jgi:hypothetical protein
MPATQQANAMTLYTESSDIDHQITGLNIGTEQ